MFRMFGLFVFPPLLDDYGDRLLLREHAARAEDVAQAGDLACRGCRDVEPRHQSTPRASHHAAAQV